MIGTKLAHYEITAHLGSGGMGDVYQATDTKLGRSVAIKFLPEPFAEEPERVARFKREARLLASLNHPNIAAIHGLEETGGRRFLVMELVPGQTLADRIQRGPLPVDEALGLARQIASALDSAHEKGVVHRDLKPANIKITPEGDVKVLDFGLAKAFEPDSASANPSDAPTISMAATKEGVILGTAAYMSPEQVRGKSVDRRTDIWAFGAVLYEMVTGRRLFEGETMSDILAAVLGSGIRIDQAPPRVRLLLASCLERDPRKRLRDIGDALKMLELQPESPVPVRISRFWIPWGVAAVFAVLLGASLLRPHFVESHPVSRWTITQLNPRVFDGMALSPDGARLAYVNQLDTQHRLWVRRLDQFEGEPIPGTEDGRRVSMSLRHLDH